ncbi:hypothetical protein K1719_040750 [Acacia pycnantha]|nr:hypothetical protein K1719_040750 [Acacia pycnantha]
MFSPSSSHHKTLHPLHQASYLKPSSSSRLSSMKLKSLIHTLIVSRMCRIIRALSKVKTIIVEILRDNQPIHKKHHTSKSKKIILGSFRLHYNWCSSKSSHVLPVPTHIFQELPSSSSAATNSCYDSSWNVPSCEQQVQGGELCPESQLAGYLQWLEDKGTADESSKREINEIDLRAEMFIANCHEKFKLEKQESDRRFQEMLARSM